MIDSTHYAWPGPKSSQVISVDAKLRNTIMVKDTSGNIRYCSEDGPRAIGASSLSLAGILGVRASQREARGSLATGQTVASLEHTQTVNLLSRSLYRTCELWASGALSQQQLVARAARDHRSMVAVLAIEQMTGVVKPKSTIISGPAVAAALTQSEETIKLLEEYRKERKTAEDAQTAAKTTRASAVAALAPLEKTYRAQGEAEEKPLCKHVSAPSEDEAVKSAFAKCGEKDVLEQAKVTADADVASKEAAYKEAAEREKKVLGQLGVLARGISSGVTGGAQDGGGDSGSSRITSLDHQKLTTIAGAVKEIALTAGIHESLVFCTSYLEDWGNKDTVTTHTCASILAANAIQDLNTNEAVTKQDSSKAIEQIEQTQDRIRGNVRGYDFNSFLEKFKASIDGISDEAQVERIVGEFEAEAKPEQSIVKNCDTKENCKRAARAGYQSTGRERLNDLNRALKIFEQRSNRQ